MSDHQPDPQPDGRPQRRGGRRRLGKGAPNAEPDGREQAGGEETETSPTLKAVPMFSEPAAWAEPTEQQADWPLVDPTDHSSDPAGRPPSRGWVDLDSSIDWALVRRLKAESVDGVDEQCQDYRRRHGREPNVDDERELGKPVITRAVADHARSEAADGVLWPPGLEDRYFKAVFDAQFGFGRLQPLFEIPTAENVAVHGCDSVKVRHNDGRIQQLPAVGADDDELMEQIRQIGSNVRPRRVLDAHNIDMTVMLGHRFRMHVISNEVSLRPRISIRQHLLTRVAIGDLVDRTLMPEDVGFLLDAAVRANLTVAVAGEQGAGKTTFLRALIDAIPMDDSFGTLETDLELFAHLMPGRENELALHARSGMGDLAADGTRIGEIGISAMVDMALRQDLRRIIVGEVRGSEASALFQAMATGTGTMFTIHSRNPQTVPIRLASRVAEGRVYSVEEAMRQIGLLVDLIVYVDVIDDRHNGGTRRRRITEIAHCTPGEYGRPSISPIFTTDPDGNPRTFTPPPDLLEQLTRHTRSALHRHENRPPLTEGSR